MEISSQINKMSVLVDMKSKMCWCNEKFNLEEIVEIIESNGYLTTFNFVNTSMDDDDLIGLLTYLPKNLRALDFSNNKITDYGVLRLMEFVSVLPIGISYDFCGTRPSFLHINLSKNQITKKSKVRLLQSRGYIDVFTDLDKSNDDVICFAEDKHYCSKVKKENNKEEMKRIPMVVPQEEGDMSRDVYIALLD